MFWIYFVRDFYRAGSAHSTATTQRRRPAPAFSTRYSFPLDASPAAADTAATAAPHHVRVTQAATLPWGESFVKSAPAHALPAEDDPDLMQVQEDVLLLSRKMQKLQAALAVSDRGRSAFLSSMSHELRTPLNAIMGFSDMMRSAVFGPIDNPTYAQYVQHIHDSGALLLNKINDLLDIASMDACEMQISESECELGPILEELLEIHSHAAFARRQTVHLDVSGNIRLNADRTKLLCVLSHLVSNALRHSPDGGEITVMARIQDEDGLVLSVRDAGEGIPAEQLRGIREALQAPAAYQHIACGGIGLGLSLSKELAEAHGGRLTIDSMRRRGTVAAIILPAERILSGLPKRLRSKIETGEWRLV